MTRIKRSHKVGQRTSKSKFNNVKVANGIKGFYISYDDGNKIDDVSAIITSWGSWNGRKDKTPNEYFLTIEVEEFEGILKHLEGASIEDIAYPAKLDEDNKIYLFAKSDERNEKELLTSTYIMPQSDFYGVTINGRKLAATSPDPTAKGRKVELQIFTETKVNFHNVAYASKSKDGAICIYDERITTEGVRCVFTKDEQGNIIEKQALYLPQNLQFTDEKDEEGKFFANVTPEEACKLYNQEEIQYCIDEGYNKEEAVIWEYDKDTYLMPASLIELYKEEGIEYYPTLQQAIDDDVFAELPNGADTLEGQEGQEEQEEAEQERDFEQEIEDAANIAEARKIAVESGLMTVEEAKTFTNKSKLYKAFLKK